MQKEKLVVTVIPLQPDLTPFYMSVEYDPEVDRNLKCIFDNPINWKPVFQGHSPIYPP
jgi:hypothetical protein